MYTMYGVYAVLDFEATCWENEKQVQEIIEFPIVLVDTKGEIFSKFESLVKPVINPKLSTFCTELTSITQDQVDAAQTFKRVYLDVTDFMERHNLFSFDEDTKVNFIWVTCGDWDLKTMLPAQFKLCGFKDSRFGKWINIKKEFELLYNRKAKGMPDMLKYLELELLGTHHRGIDDSINIARILKKMIESGWMPRTSSEETLPEDRPPAPAKCSPWLNYDKTGHVLTR